MKNIIKMFVMGLFIFTSFSCNSFAESIESINDIQPGDIIEWKSSDDKTEDTIEPYTLYERKFIVSSTDTDYDDYKYFRGTAIQNKASVKTSSSVRLAKSASSSVTATAGGTITASDKTTITASIGASSLKSYSVDTTKTMSIPSGKCGWFDYRVGYKVRKGNIYTYTEQGTSKKL